ncbi:MAG TPA: hypothetical protein VGO59_02105 [Verrucomicrobiae bacterium]|jgi:hypothetical protein
MGAVDEFGFSLNDAVDGGAASELDGEFRIPFQAVGEILNEDNLIVMV